MTFTQHALDRFMERSGIRDTRKAMNRLDEKISSARLVKRIGKTRYLYHDGWILVLNKG